MPKMIALFSLAELSTPSLHMRWLFLQIKKTDSMSFLMANYSFIILFFLVRIIILPIFGVFVMSKDIYNCYFNEFIGILSCKVYRPAWINFIYLICMWLWVLLNYYWAFIVFYNNFIKRRKVKKE